MNCSAGNCTVEKSAPQWADLLGEPGLCSAAPASRLTALFSRGDLVSVEAAARQRQVTPEILMRFIRADRWPALLAAFAAGGEQFAQRYLEMFFSSCEANEHSQDLPRLTEELLFEDLTLFDVLAKYNVTRVPDNHLVETAEAIRHWAEKALEESSENSGRVRRIFERARSQVKRAANKGDGNAALQAIEALSGRQWKLFREAVRASGATILRELPINMDAFADTVDGAIEDLGDARRDRRVRGKLRNLKRQIPYLFRCDPLDFVEHWLVLGSDETLQIELAAERRGIALWQDPEPDAHAMLVVLDALLKSKFKVGHASELATRHLYKVLALDGAYLIGNRDWTNADGRPTGRLVDFVEDALCCIACGAFEFSEYHFREAISEMIAAGAETAP